MCDHEFVLETTGSRRFLDGEPTDNLVDHIICELCGYEKTEEVYEQQSICES